MNYTKQETEYLEKLLRRLEKEKKHWPWLRWLILFASIFLIGAAFYILNLHGHLQDSLSSTFSMPKKEFDPKMVKLFVDSQLANLRLEFIILIKIVLYEIIGAGMLVYCLKNWNRHTRNGIIIKAIKESTSEKR